MHFPRNAELSGEFVHMVAPVLMNGTNELSDGEAQEAASGKSRPGRKLDVDREAVGSVDRFVDGLAQRRVGVDSRDKFVVGRLECDGETELCDHFCRIRANDVCAQDFAVRFSD